MTSLRRIDSDFSGTERFTILRRLGAGGIGVVYEAHDSVRNKRVALKTMQRMDSTALYRLENEFHALADVSHPNLAALYDFVAEDGQVFFTMELVEGCEFLTYVRGDVDRLRSTLQQLVSGVSAIHLADKLHRDIKPSNVLVTPNGHVVLLDFGLVTGVDEHALGGHAVVGTAEYMSPEQASGGELSEASDWYSVGTMLYEALTGTLPFQGTFMQIQLDKQRRDVEPPSSIATVPPDLDSLCGDLLQHDPSQRPTGAEILRRLQGDLSCTTEPPFVGRDAILERLQDAFRHTQGGQAVLVWVHGSTGMGKSALLQRFVDSLPLSSEVVVLSGRCYEREDVSFKAFDRLIEGLVGMLRELPHGEAKALLPVEILALTEVFPWLERVPAVAAVPRRAVAIADPQERRRRALRVFRELLQRMATRHPLVLWLDDVQWGDMDSAQLLAALLRPPAPPSLLVLLSYRTEGAEGSPFLTALRDPRVADFAAVRELTVDVGALDADHAERLASLLFPKCSDVLAKRIAVESQGSPYLVGELVRFAQAGGAVEAMPSGLSDALQRRIFALAEEPRGLLCAVAAAGRPVSDTMALFVADLRGGAGRRAVALLRAQHLIGTSCSSLVPYHDLVRETVLAHLDPERKRALHSRLAIALLAAGQNDPDVLCEHFAAAGNTEREVEFAQLAATKAEAALGFDRAAMLYERLLELAGPEAPEAKTWIGRLADALHNAGRYARAAEHRLQLASVEPNPRAAFLLRSEAAQEFLCSGHFERGNALLEEVLRLLGYFVPRAPWLTLLALLVARLVLRLRGLGVRTMEQDTEQLREGALCTDALASAGIGFGMTDNVRGSYFQVRALLRALGEGDTLRLVRLIPLETCYSAAGGRRTEARTRTLLAHTERLAQQVALPHAQGWLAMARGWCHFFLGQLPGTRKHLFQAVQIFSEECTGEAWAAASCMSLALRAIQYMGDLRELSERVLPAVQEMEATGDLLGLVNLRTEPLAWVRLAQDNLSVADHELQQVARELPQTRFTVQSWFHFLCRTQLELYRDDRKEALLWVERQWKPLARSLLMRVSLIELKAWDLRGRVFLASAANNSQGSEGRQRLLAVEAIARRLARLGYGVSDGFAAQLRTGVLTLRGQRDEAARSAEEAQRAFERASMKLHAAASQWTQGVLLGDTTRIADARAVFEGEHVRCPERFVAMLAPGVLG
jgi:tetratricopeptide (TPR) repeat protein